MATRLYSIPGSHPSMAGRLMLEHKGISYKRTDLASPLHRGVLRALRFPGKTVPALSHEGRKVQGTRELSRYLDEIQPDPPLFPTDPAQRAAVEEAERWGDEVLQPPPRRLAWWALKRDKSEIGSFLADARLGLPTPVLARTSGPLIRLAARANDVTDEAVNADLAAIPGLIDRVDELIAAGTIGGETLNAADFQIAPSVRLLMSFEDLRPAIEARPAGRQALRVCPDWPGRIPSVMDADERALALGSAG
jgi:glutathione S-transferase